MYVCGITPYDVGHLGHAFTYVFFDTVRRYLEFQGLDVQHIQNMVLYGATKGGINEFTRGLAVELGPHGITANVIAPGTIYVPRYDRVGADKSTMASTVPNGQLGDVDDIGRTAAFLADPEADYISGEILYVDAGLTSKMALTGGAQRT